MMEAEQRGAEAPSIVITGARENNLKNVKLSIPKHSLTVFTGVSGSGKSSIVFSTLAAESQRLMNETYPAFVQGFMAAQDRPQVDAMEGLTAVIVVDQERLGANPRSTLGTVTDIDSKMRLLFSRLSVPQVGGPQAFSFNVPSASGAGAVAVEKNGRTVREKRSFEVVGGQCPRCEGLATVREISPQALIDMEKSLEDGALDAIPGYKVGQWAYRSVAESGMFDPSKPIASYTKRELDDLLYKAPTKIKFSGFNFTYEGLLPKLTGSIFAKDPEDMQPAVRALAERAVTFGLCPDCGGSRLAAHALEARVNGTNIAEANAMQISDLLAWIRSIDDADTAPILRSIEEGLASMVDIGLGYLALSRPTSTLSGGETQRAKMVRHLGSALTDVTYIFDEPTTGLHAHDVEKMNSILLGLRDKGNTVVVVEHEPRTIRIADHIIDLGPGAGDAGGEICYEGDVSGLLSSSTLTGKHLADKPQVREKFREPRGVLEIRGARANNLREVNVDIPLGTLVAVTGVAGSGKSSLIHRSLPASAGAIHLDQSPIRGSRRSNPATYTGLLDHVRKAFAKAHGVKPGLFSANSDGACPACQGAGLIFTDLAMMATVSSVCEVCGGRRFNDEVLAYTLGGKNIADVFDMPAAQAQGYFAEVGIKQAAALAGAMVEAGIGYLRLGQALTTLSGGERQRLKLALVLGSTSAKKVKETLVVLDEPTTGLHMADVSALLALLDRLVDQGMSVIVIEHDLAVIAHADHVIDMGPGAGHDGGTVIFEGSPRELMACEDSLTGQHLAREIAG